MKPVHQTFVVEADGLNFCLRAPSALLTLSLQALLPQSGGGGEVSPTMISRLALLIAYVWEPTGELGALDFVPRPAAELRGLTAADIDAMAEAALSEFDAAGVSLSAISQVATAIIRRISGADVLEGAGKVSDFTVPRTA